MNLFRSWYLLLKLSKVGVSIIICGGIWFLLSGCSFDRLNVANHIAEPAGLKPFQLQTQPFPLQGWARKGRSSPQRLVVYIEGDGFAWITAYQPSSDPTPRDPTALRLAALDPAETVIYLARPCQYISNSLCSNAYWTSHRFSEEVIASYQQALDILKNQYGAHEFELIGYSGGAAIATLVAARRQDVTKIITIAGNLDHDLWTKIHDISPLYGSLNPRDYAQKLQSIPQVHYCGAKDDNIVEAVIRSYQQALGNKAPSQVFVINGQDHYCCWHEIWRELRSNETHP